MAWKGINCKMCGDKMRVDEEAIAGTCWRCVQEGTRKKPKRITIKSFVEQCLKQQSKKGI